ncbi:MAG: response regulator [Proteobacteria bacterium]|nr:response regulator [Pseudomonadota bacterium]MBU1583527.1 response regulator [Pseudomonadota bacterium]MBU2454973.1 response regulator [Pseudomonadota bacterium]MBU2631094.1 response regulator [Pseudomonadota bacterium]
MNNQHINILLIDDEIEFISTLAERLEIRGYTSKIAEDGESGIRMLANESFDIAILDLMMPGLNGLDTLRQIKTIDDTLPVILLTGHGSTKDGMEGMRLGAFDFLMKPLDINELLQKIKLALSESQKGGHE